MDSENLSDVTNNSDSEKEEKPQTKNLVQGKAFKKLQKKALSLGAKSLDYSKQKSKKYVVETESGKKINFGSIKYEDFLIHKDEERRQKYLKRTKNIKNKKGELTYNNSETANYWSRELLW